MARPRTALAFLVVLLPAGALSAEKMKAQEVVARHGEAVGPEGARAAARSLEGSSVLTAPASGGIAGALTGRFTFDSERSRFALRMKFPSQAYPAESFGLEGGKGDVSFVLPGRRSGLGSFVDTHDVILREGLLGGVLNAGWPLFALEERGARVSYDGLKKLEGHELHRLSYRARKGQDTLDILLFFDPDTFRHVASVYKASKAQQLGTTMESSSSEPDMYLQMQETFGDFKSVKGLALPTSWAIRYEMQAKVTQYWKYELVVEALQR
jgi:hypothetical protein